MTVRELIEKLQALPPDADVLFDDLDAEEYRDITVEVGAVDFEHQASLVLIGRAE